MAACDDPCPKISLRLCVRKYKEMNDSDRAKHRHRWQWRSMFALVERISEPLKGIDCAMWLMLYLELDQNSYIGHIHLRFPGLKMQISVALNPYFQHARRLPHMSQICTRLQHMFLSIRNSQHQTPSPPLAIPPPCVDSNTHPSHSSPPKLPQRHLRHPPSRTT